MMNRKRLKTSGPQAAGLIQMMTISLFIILLAFFILLNSIALIDTRKQSEVVGAVNSSFGGKARVQGEVGDTENQAFLEEGSPVEFSDLVAGEEGKDISVSVSRTRSTARIPSDLLFDGYGTSVTKSGAALLDRLAKMMAGNSFQVEITGHTDNVPLPEGKGSNRELSSLRSIKVVRYLVEKAGVEPSRLAASGWGGFRPFFSNKTVESRRLNRRIDVTFIHDGTFEKEDSIFIFKDFFFRVSE